MEGTNPVAVLAAQAREDHAAERFPEAIERYLQLVSLAPERGDAWRNLAILAFRSGDGAAARALLARALSIDAGDAAAYRIRATIDEVEGRPREAYAGYAKACSLDPAQSAATVALARLALALGHAGEARDVALAAVARGIDDADLLRTLGAAHAMLGDYSAAAAALAAALRREPHAGAFAHLAAAQLRLDRVDAALAACRSALALDPAHAPAMLHLGIARYARGAYRAAAAAFERALALGCEEAHINLARLALLQGDFETGWRHFGCDDAVRRALPVFAALPMWDGSHDGSPAAARRLLVWHEQGVGDTIQMVRFLKAARERIGSITLACPRSTHALFAGVAGVDAVIDQRRPRFDAFDCWLPTTRLPVIFDARPQTLPPAPYLRADRTRVVRFAPELSAPQALRVGLVWSGNPRYAQDAVRSCGLAALEPLAGIAGVAWFALQQGPARDERPRGGMRLVPVNAAVSDFADTAALVAGLDLVITVDTSVAHLAGALGRPAWVMLPERCDWRWGLAGDDSPWYPTVRLFRARDGGGWAPVVAALADALRRLIAERVTNAR